MKLTDAETAAFKAGQLEVWVESPEDGMEYKVADIDDDDHFVAQRYSGVEEKFLVIDGKLGDFPAALPLTPAAPAPTIETIQ